MRSLPAPVDWGLQSDAQGRLLLGSIPAVDLASEFGTPLHVVDEPRLEATARDFRRSMEDACPGRVSVHYAFKCNSVPAVVDAVRRGGLGAEIMSEFELELALRKGFPAAAVVVNGPAKSPTFIAACLDAGVRLIAVDSLEELALVGRIASERRTTAPVLLRINPDYVPRGMNQGTATGSRRGCAFGLDLKGDEPALAFAGLRESKSLRFQGFHMHIGTGIRDPREYGRALDRLAPLVRAARAAGFPVAVMDVGGGYASRTTRALTTREFLVYQGLGILPSFAPGPGPVFADFGREIAAAVGRVFAGGPPPEILFEPGRAIASPNQVLLLTVQNVKIRPRVRTWIVTDGGLGTVSLPTFYEYHEIFLADDVRRPRTGRATIIGSVCFASDIVYRNKPMPAVRSGETLAVCDSGAYFTAQESSFGFPRPAVVCVAGPSARIVRRRETYADMTGRDGAAG
jgi:diaminopimelate decarboxylase